MGSSEQCSVCGITCQKIKKIDAEKQKAAERMRAGLFLDMNARALLICKKCNSYACSDCALSGPEVKRCPSRRADYDFGSVVC